MRRIIFTLIFSLFLLSVACVSIERGRGYTHDPYEESKLHQTNQNSLPTTGTVEIKLGGN